MRLLHQTLAWIKHLSDPNPQRLKSTIDLVCETSIIGVAAMALVYLYSQCSFERLVLYVCELI